MKKIKEVLLRRRRSGYPECMIERLLVWIRTIEEYTEERRCKSVHVLD
jgi:hypothetical protein